MRKLKEIFVIFLRLGLTSFGGPVAHLGFFHQEFVNRRKWIDEHSYADLVAFCQFLPGPASSQVGMAIGLARGGILGSIAAWLGFTLPSAILLTLFGFGLNWMGIDPNSNWIHGLKVAAAAVVAQAVWNMGVKLCPDKQRVTIAVCAAIAVALFFSAWTQLAAIFFGGVLGVFLFSKTLELPSTPKLTNLGRRTSFSCLIAFIGLLFVLPIFAQGAQWLRLFDSFFRVGSLVFGGGHVVLPLLQSEVVSTGWIGKDVFLAGYGAAQAVPGPLFSFAAFLGSVVKIGPSGWQGASICLVAIYLPSFLLIIGLLPVWDRVRKIHKMRNAMLGINAAVVGLLLAALYNPIWTNAILNTRDFCLGIAAFTMLVFWRAPSWAVVVFSAVAARVFL